MKRPEVCTTDMLVFLDALRAEGRNMFGVTATLEYQFMLSPHDAASVLQYWLLTFGQDGER